MACAMGSIATTTSSSPPDRRPPATLAAAGPTRRTQIYLDFTATPHPGAARRWPVSAPAFLRRESIHQADLDRWRASSLEGLSGKVAAAATADQTDKRVRDLEKELRRKEKAVAEAAALLVLQKQLKSLLGDEDENT